MGWDAQMAKHDAEPRKKPKQARSALMFDAVVMAASKVLEKEGAEALTTSRVAEVAGVSVGSLYQYFPNKWAIVSALIEKYVTEDYALFVEMAGAAHQVPIAVSVPALVRGMLGMYRTNAAVRGILFDQMSLVGRTPFLHRMLREYVGTVKQLLSARQQEIAPTVDDTLAYLVLHAVEGALRAVVLDPPDPFDEERFVALMSSMVLGLLGVRTETVTEHGTLR
ncbi:MAG: TetR/AcrR family transcriptional regulator [Myxococcota bacterium]